METLMNSPRINHIHGRNFVLNSWVQLLLCKTRTGQSPKLFFIIARRREMTLTQWIDCSLVLRRLFVGWVRQLHFKNWENAYLPRNLIHPANCFCMIGRRC